MKIIQNLILVLSISQTFAFAATPTNPSELVLTPTKTSVLLSWRDNSDNESGFKILRDGELIYTTNENIETYTDRGLTPNTTYKYNIIATNSDPDFINDTGIIINEVVAGNIDIKLDPDFNQYSDYIELHNTKSSSVNIGGFYLSDDKSPTKWKIPSDTTILANGYILVWADKEDIKRRALHTNFSLSLKKEKITLSDKNANVIDEISYKKIKGDVAIQVKNGEVVYMNPTPNRVNSVSYSKSTQLNEPIYSQKSGFYSGTQMITLSQEDGAKIYYTLDGSTPTESSTLYTKEIKLNKTTSIRSRSIKAGQLPSKLVAKTYLIDEEVSLPVVSIAMDDKYLYDSDIGIYTRGNHANYEQDWMRPASIEYIKDGDVKFSVMVGVKIHGNNTRKLPQKSLAIYSKSKFGSKGFKNLFSQKPNIKKSKNFILRSGGTGWGRDLIGDAIEQTIISDIPNIDYQAYEDSVVVFINGKYMGIHNIREKINDDYIKENHGVDTKEIDLLENHAEIKKGSNSAYLELEEYIKTRDMRVSQNYNYALSKIDIDELINYNIIESFVGNGSIGHNIKYWRKIPDGKWRWLLFDLDRGFRDIYSYVFEYILNDEINEIFINLLKNDQFKNRFASRYYTYMQTIFKTQRMDEIIKQKSEHISSEVERHFKRWPKGRHDEDVSVDTWREAINGMYDFSNRRSSRVYSKLKSRLDLDGDFTITIQRAQNGKILLDDIELKEDFNGHYFSGAKITLEAVPDADHSFVGWSDGDINTKKEIKIDKDFNIKAEFN